MTEIVTTADAQASSGGQVLPADLSPIQKAEVVEAELMKHPQVECPVVHHFGPGVYIREATFPSGTLAVGHCHKFEHLNILLKGRITVINGDGARTEFTAPCVFVGAPGKKVAYIHEETVWQNIHATTETDIEKIEEIFIEKSQGWLEHNAARALSNEPQKVEN